MRFERNSAGLVVVVLLLAACTSTSSTTTVTSAATATAATPTTTVPEAPADAGGRVLNVTTTADHGSGSLRQALEDGRAGDTITFDPTVFPPTDPATIYVSGDQLPHIRVDDLIVDASDAGVILDGSELGGEWDAGLQVVSSHGSTIMGLQISRFSGPGIAISGSATGNVIGGDRGVGLGPWGQGNLFSQNEVGVAISASGAAFNVVAGNLIGTDLAGTDWMGNRGAGVTISEGAHDNTIGPGNIIANNSHCLGVDISDDAAENAILENEIYDNGIGKSVPSSPVILDHDLASGIAVGATCELCTVEVYSTADSEGEVFEASATADQDGIFSISTGAAFAGPSLTARTIDTHGNTSGFSWPPTVEAQRAIVMQQGNDRPRTRVAQGFSDEMIGNGIATQFDSFGLPYDFTDVTMIYGTGVSRARVSISGLEPELVNWEKPELEVVPGHDDMFDRMADNGIEVTYVLIFWDKDTYPNGEGAPCARFKTEAEIQRWLDYVRRIVSHLTDRVHFFEIWNEPDIEGYCPKWIELADYVNLITRTVPVIREVAPEAKIVVGAVSNTFFEQDYLFGLLESAAMPLVDVISWHPMYGTSPEYDLYREYYYEYPDFVQRIRDTAVAHGFEGEFRVDELTWRSTAEGEDQPWVYTPVTAGKYFARAAIMHLGLGIDIGLGSGYYFIRNLTTAVDGAQPAELTLDIAGPSADVMSYSFFLPDGGHMVGLWTNGIASEFDPGIEATVTISGVTADRVIGVDVLAGFEQELSFQNRDGDVVIPNLLIKDYPTLIELDTRS